MRKVDFKKELAQFYPASAKEVVAVELPMFMLRLQASRLEPESGARIVDDLGCIVIDSFHDDVVRRLGSQLYAPKGAPP